MDGLEKLLRAIFEQRELPRVAVGTKDRFRYFINLTPREDGYIAVLVADTSVVTEQGWKGYSTLSCCREHARESALEVIDLLMGNPNLEDAKEFVIPIGKEGAQTITDPDLINHLRSGGKLN